MIYSEEYLRKSEEHLEKIGIVLANLCVKRGRKKKRIEWKERFSQIRENRILNK